MALERVTRPKPDGEPPPARARLPPSAPRAPPPRLPSPHRRSVSADASAAAWLLLARIDPSNAIVHSMMQGAREALLAVGPGDNPRQREQRGQILRRLHAALALADTEARDFAAAERNWRLAHEAMQGLPRVLLQARQEQHSDLAKWAYTLARLGRIDEAKPKAAEALAFWRDLQTKAHDDQMHKLDVAATLVAAAWCDPPRARPLLDEAQATFDSMPADARGLRSSRRIEALIAEARRGLR